MKADETQAPSVFHLYFICGDSSTFGGRGSPAMVGWPGMRRVWRIFVNALTIGSLLLCLALAVLWVRSYSRSDNLVWHRPPAPGVRGAELSVSTGAGGAGINLFRYAPTTPAESRGGGWAWETYYEDWIEYSGGWRANRWGLGVIHNDHARGRHRGLVFPFWLPTVLLGLLPLIRLTSWMRRR